MTERTRKTEDANHRSASSRDSGRTSPPAATVSDLQRRAGNAATTAFLLQRQKNRPKLGRGWGDADDYLYNPDEDDATYEPEAKPPRRRKPVAPVPPVEEVRGKAPPLVPSQGPTAHLENLSEHRAEHNAGVTVAFQEYRILQDELATLRGLISAARLKIREPVTRSDLTPELVGDIVNGYVTAKLYNERGIVIADGTGERSNVARALDDMKERTTQVNCPEWNKRRPKLATMVAERVKLDRGQVGPSAVETACAALVRATEAMAAEQWPVKKIEIPVGAKVRRPNVDREYPYGGPNTIPHVHHYGPDSHVKISIDQSIERIDLVKAGSPTLRVGEARAAAAKNETLLAVINELVRLAT